MEIRKNTWHYQVWQFTYFGHPPKYTTLCGYVNRIVFLSIPSLVASLALMVLYFGILGTINIVTIGSGTGVYTMDDDGYMRSYFSPIRIGKHGGVSWRTVLLSLYAGLGLLLAGVWYPGILLRVVGILALSAIAIGILALIWRAGKTRVGKEEINLLRNYMRAKKEGWCPSVTFVDKEQLSVEE